MEVVVTTGAIRHAKLQSKCHHQQTNTQFFTGQMPFLSPNQQCQSTEGNKDIKDIDKLEKVQRRFTKRLPGLKHYTYFQ